MLFSNSQMMALYNAQKCAYNAQKCPYNAQGICIKSLCTLIRKLKVHLESSLYVS